MSTKTKKQKKQKQIEAVTTKKVSNKDKAQVLVLGQVTEPVGLAGGKANYYGVSEDAALNAVERADALLLTGGVDLDPLLYGQAPHPQAQSPWEHRDLVEWCVLEKALERGIPVLGICRGMQMINVFMGGSLHQHLPDLEYASKYHNGHTHRVKAAKGSRLRQAFGAEERWALSLHHQAVDRLGDGLVATAWARDGIVEAVEGIEGWILGVQFHPEMELARPGMKGIFNSFVRAAARKAGLPVPVPTAYVEKPAKMKSASELWAEDQLEWCSWERHAERSKDAEDKRDAWKTPVKAETAKVKLTRSGKTRVYWRCFRCNIDFDEQIDHADHMAVLHQVDVQG